jgi:hypothetical protein
LVFCHSAESRPGFSQWWRVDIRGHAGPLKSLRSWVHLTSGLVEAQRSHQMSDVDV